MTKKTGTKSIDTPTKAQISRHYQSLGGAKNVELPRQQRGSSICAEGTDHVGRDEVGHGDPRRKIQATIMWKEKHF
jgi:hypothetical protein